MEDSIVWDYAVWLKTIVGMRGFVDRQWAGVDLCFFIPAGGRIFAKTSSPARAKFTGISDTS
ncbi:MAG: hypothetical protein KDC54_08145 [Lewinella sp.]|nr:hypothetical protein [Lewinella sp.]